MVKIFVEGIADQKFLNDYINHISPSFTITKDTIIQIEGWTNIKSQETNGENIRNSLQKNTANNGVNLIIFDADNDFSTRKLEIEDWKTKYNLEFELFLLPNNQNSGALEDLLEKIIFENNQSIVDCWNKFETCIQECASKVMQRPLTIPAKKTKIYAYLEVLLGETKSEKEKIKEKYREYDNRGHWNLGSPSLDPLKTFLLATLP